MERILASMIIFSLLSTCHSFLPTNTTVVMELERVQPRLSLNETKLVDHSRRSRMASGGATFALDGSFSVGLYSMKLEIGSPFQEYTLMVDTGSSISWVPCVGCHDCSRSNNSGLQLYNPSNSSTCSLLSCHDKQRDTNGCDFLDSECWYTITYMDQTVTVGFMFSDVIYFYMEGEGRISTSVIFGCTKNHSGFEGRPVDGVLGLGARPTSFISQLSMPFFSHCFKGGEDSGGILIFGDIVNLTAEYTPLNQLWNDYRVILQSIDVDGKIVDINPSVHNSENGATIFDSGTTLVHLAQHVHDPVINALKAIVSISAEEVHSQCFKPTTSKRIDDIFPPITFNFEGGASMLVQPKDYLFTSTHLDGHTIWCIGLEKSTDEYANLTILGEIVQRDKVIIYDIAQERLGWASHNCSKHFNITLDSSARSSCVDGLLVIINSLILLIYLIVFG